MPAVLIDTNVLVYAHDPVEQKRHHKATQILNELWQRESGVVSAQVLGEFFTTVIRPKLNNPPRLTPLEAFEQVQFLSIAFKVYDVTAFTVLEAVRGLRHYGLSYYDAQIWATARQNQIPVVFSEDFQDGQLLEGVRFINPFTPQFSMEAWV